MFDADAPIFQQLADRIVRDILGGIYADDTPVPSTNELAAFFRINPATAGKALNLLVDDGVLYKKRGVGMFVSPGAHSRLTEARRTAFVADFIRPLTAEAASIGIEPATIHHLIDKETQS